MAYEAKAWECGEYITNDDLNHMEGGIAQASAQADDVFTRMATAENNINVLDARMDTFVSLPDGSTAGDAELLDIRVGADGTVYPSAGDAVRGQVTDLKSDYNAVNNQMAYINGSLISPPYEIGCRYVSSGNEMYNDNPTRITFKRGYYLNLKQGDVMSVDSSFAQTYLGGYSTDGGATFTGFSGGATEEYIAPVNGKYFFCLVKKK